MAQKGRLMDNAEVGVYDRGRFRADNGGYAAYGGWPQE